MPGRIKAPFPIGLVCKMNVDESKATAVPEYEGKKYYFRAAGYKMAFDKNPEAYLSGVAGVLPVAAVAIRGDDG